MGGRKPSQVWNDQCWATFERDALGVRIAHHVVPDSLCWANDFPHTNSPWPVSHEVIDDLFAGTAPEARRKITHDNFLRIFGLQDPELAGR
jgi:hypothetical protein